MKMKQICIYTLLLSLSSTIVFSQISSVVPHTTKDHQKQVIGYITQWDAWKNINNLIPAGSSSQLNINYSQYTILNFSFFGLANDGSLHSADLRNAKTIAPDYQPQLPAPIIDSDTYSSWDMYILFGSLYVTYYIQNNDVAYNLGYRNDGSGWKNINTGAIGSFPLTVPDGSKNGLIDLCHANGVKAVASIGGWSMSEEFPSVSASPNKRAVLASKCKWLVNTLGFDGIDIDWEYPNGSGMQFTGTTADYGNFTLLMQQIRDSIGANAILTACFSNNINILTGFNYTALSKTLNYFNFFGYDFNGGWSTIAGHNAPLYNYPGSENSNYNDNALIQKAISLGIPANQINMGIPFYGRGVICNAQAGLSVPTVQTSQYVLPDGQVTTSADYDNWPTNTWAATPNFNAIQQSTTNWNYYWDDNAKVPYKTNGKYFLSYDDTTSIGYKARYIVANNLAGTIVWNVYGDLQNMAAQTVPVGTGNKLVSCPQTTSILVNTINNNFATSTNKVTNNVITNFATPNPIDSNNNGFLVTPNPVYPNYKVTGITEGDNVQVYDMSGNQLFNGISQSSVLNFTINHKVNFFIVKVQDNKNHKINKPIVVPGTF